MKVGNYLFVCAFVVCLVLEAFAFLLRNPISCPGLWGLKNINIKLKIYPLFFRKDRCFDIINPLNTLVIKITLTTELCGMHSECNIKTHGDKMSMSRMMTRYSCCRAPYHLFCNSSLSATHLSFTTLLLEFKNCFVAQSLQKGFFTFFFPPFSWRKPIVFLSSNLR